MNNLNHLSAKEVASYSTYIINSRPFPKYLNIKANSFRKSENMPMTIRRAKALNDILKESEILVNPGELLVGTSAIRTSEKGDEHLLNKDLEYLNIIGSRSFVSNSDHHVVDYYTILDLGIGGLLDKTTDSFNNSIEIKKKTFLESMVMALNGVSNHILRWADEIKVLSESNPEYKDLLLKQHNIIKKISKEAPSTFWEALQLIVLINLPIMCSDERYAMAFGRLDQYLYSFYKNDIEKGKLTNDDVQDLLDHFFAKVADNVDVRNIAIGGLDVNGKDAVNELTYMILEACKKIGKPGGNITARISEKNPNDYVKKCAEVIRTGIGYPAVFNDDLEIKALIDLGYKKEDAYNYCFVGCIEVFMAGKQAPWSDSRFNLLQCVDFVLRDGYDTVLEKYNGLRTGVVNTWDEFWNAYVKQVSYCLNNHISEVMSIKKTYDSNPYNYTSPMVSAFTSDCIGRGLDLCNGGTIYPANHGIGGMGIGSTADALMAIKYFVYDNEIYTLDEYIKMLDANFVGYEEERKRIINESPKYGNNIDEVDDIAVKVAKLFADECSKYITPTGGFVWGLMAANVNNVYAGKEVGASPDGRLAFEPLSDAASPTFGRDKNGATSSIASISKLDYAKHPGGNVINMRLHPSVLTGDRGLDSVVTLIRSCFKLGGIELQFNTTDRKVLLDAMESPEKYEDLVVRVSGFSANYITLEHEVQLDILARTTHERI